MLEYLKSEDEFDAKIKKGVVLVDFFAQWCGPCNALTPILEEVAEEKKDANILKIDVDEFPELASKFNVASIPTLIVMKEGEAAGRHVGSCDKNKIFNLLSC